MKFSRISLLTDFKLDSNHIKVGAEEQSNNSKLLLARKKKQLYTTANANDFSIGAGVVTINQTKLTNQNDNDNPRQQQKHLVIT